MKEYFVYGNTTYYPWAEIHTAETPEEAWVKAGSLLGSVVFELSALVGVFEYDGGDVISDIRDAS